MNCGEFLGANIDGITGTVGATSKRIWRVRQAFDYLTRRPLVSGDEVLHVIGHATYLFLFNRGLMCIMRHLYDVAAHSRKGRVRLWESAAKEAVWVRGLVSLARSDLRRSWATEAVCSDASEDGFGVVSAHMDEHTVAWWGRWHERWRFRHDLDHTIRPRELALHEFYDDADADHAPLPNLIDKTFPDIRQEDLKSVRWKEVSAGAWNDYEDIFMLEGRAALKAQLCHYAV